jgi:hypothetical protein
MKVDLYTKSVLTVIAVCLVILTLQTLQLVPKTYAAPASATAAFNNEIRPNYDGSINVRVIAMESAVKISTLLDGVPVQSSDVETYDKRNVKLTNSYIYTKPNECSAYG